MSVTIHLQPDVERRLADRAARLGLSLEQFLALLAEREAGNGPGPSEAEQPGKGPTFEEVTGPIARAVAETRMSEDEVAEFFDDVVKEVRSEKRTKRDAPR